MKVMEAVPNDGVAEGTSPPVDPAPQVDSEATSFGKIDEELFSGTDDFEDLSLNEEMSDEISEKPPAPPPEPAPESIVEQQQPAAMPTVAPTAPVPPEPQPSPTSATVPPPAASPPALREKSYEVLRQEAQVELQKRYALSKEDADAMISEPEVVVPKLLSQVYLDVYDNVMRSMQVYLPQMVQQLNTTSTVQQRDESDFYTAWPKLKERSNEVLEIGQKYRALNPTATKEQFIQDVGLYASIALKIPVESPLVQQSQQVQNPPAASQNPPYVPPRGGPVSHTAPADKPKGMFGELAAEWEEQERDFG